MVTLARAFPKTAAGAGVKRSCVSRYKTTKLARPFIQDSNRERKRTNLDTEDKIRERKTARCFATRSSLVNKDAREEEEQNYLSTNACVC